MSYSIEHDGVLCSTVRKGTAAFEIWLNCTVCETGAQVSVSYAMSEVFQDNKETRLGILRPLVDILSCTHAEQFMAMEKKRRA